MTEEEDWKSFQLVQENNNISNEWQIYEDFEEDEISSGTQSFVAPSSSGTSVRTSHQSSLTRTNSSSIYPISDGRFTEGPAVDNAVEEGDLFSPHDPKKKQRNDIGITSNTTVIFKYSRLKKIKRLCSWLGVICLFIFGFAIFFAIIGIATNIANNQSEEPPKYNVTLFNSTMSIAPASTQCYLNYTVPPDCNGKLNEITGCISGCYLSQTQGDCGIFMNINYTDIPRTEKVSKIYLFASADGTHFWQTGRALPITVCIFFQDTFWFILSFFI